MMNTHANDDSFDVNAATASGSNAKAHNSMESEETSPSRKPRRKISEGVLCLVCSAVASGYHYGVASCSGCKTFFRRVIVKEEKFICQHNSNCDVNKNCRCLCRYCRFQKCLLVGMDPKAIQGKRDPIGTYKKFKVDSGSADEQAVTPQKQEGQQIVNRLTNVETWCQELRQCIFPEVVNVTDALSSPCLLFSTTKLKIDPYYTDTVPRELYPASMVDIKKWNIREMRICIEWAKTFDKYRIFDFYNQFALVKNFAFAFNLLNRVFYSQDYGSDRIVYQNGAFILRQPQEQVQISGCRSIYTRQMDEIMIPFRNLQLSVSEFAIFKAALFFNPDAPFLSPTAKLEFSEERDKYLLALFECITQKLGVQAGALKYGKLLMIASSLQDILAQNNENMQVMDLFENWQMDPFVKELCMKNV